MTLRVAGDLDRKMAALPAGTTILVRKALIAKLGMFETVVADLAKAHGHVVMYCQPDGNDRAAVYRRDYELVEAADRVEAYFAADRVMDGGTGHVVEAALAREIPVYAWTLDHRGNVVRVGEVESHTTI